jgi:4-diphosphocytidyl-2-C-methyl-D-erythritol kinase
LHPLSGIAAETAPAKVNLTLRVGGKRPDGYHNIESLVAFAGECDALRLTLADAPTLSVEGPFVVQSGPAEDNLVLKAAHVLARDIPALKAGHFELTKNLPAAAGLGGGSSDAAAALRLLARLNDIGANDPRLHAAACAIGADVPVCLDPRARIMRGTGELLSEPLVLPALYAVLVNPGIATATKDVFAAFDAMHPDAPVELPVAVFPRGADEATLIAWLNLQSNDLEPAALSLHPLIGEALSALRSAPGCKLARMSGSGATCFGLFDMRTAEAAAQTLHRRHPDWWVRATIFSENLDGNAPA